MRHPDVLGPRPRPPRRKLLTVHLPIDMGAYARCLEAISDAYPTAVVGEGGTVWSRRAEPGESDDAT